MMILDEILVCIFVKKIIASNLPLRDVFYKIKK